MSDWSEFVETVRAPRLTIIEWVILGTLVGIVGAVIVSNTERQRLCAPAMRQAQTAVDSLRVWDLCYGRPDVSR